MGLRRQLLGEPGDAEIARLVREGATILDIRTPEEFAQGHVPDALHIPLNELLQNLPSIPKDRPIVTCNADDAMSATAAEVLQAHGFAAYDGGGWSRLRDLLKPR
jgi:rhodanese-related sulfurtransferase